MECLRAGPYNGKTTLNCQYRIIHEKKTLQKYTRYLVSINVHDIGPTGGNDSVSINVHDIGPTGENDSDSSVRLGQFSSTGPRVAGIWIAYTILPAPPPPGGEKNMICVAIGPKEAYPCIKANNVPSHHTPRKT